MHDFMCPDPGKMYYTDLRGKAAEAKEGKEEREAMGPIMREIYNKGIETGRKEGIETGRKEGAETGRREGIETGRKEGVETGRREEARNIATNMIRTGTIPLATIAECSGLSLGDVQSIKSSMSL